MAARLTAERFVDMIEHHPELHDLLDPAVIARLVEEEL